MTAGPLLPAAAPRFGRLLATRVAGDFELRLSRYEAGVAFPAHRHPDAYFCYIVDGGCDESSGGRDRAFGPGSLHFHPAGDPHAARTGTRGLESLSIVLHGGAAAGAEGAARRLDAGIPAPLGALASRVWAEFLARDGASDLTMESAAHELLSEARGDLAVTTGGTWVARVRDYLHASFRSAVSLADLAEIAGVHEVHVVRGFRRSRGVTPGAYLRRLRLEAARRALLESDRPIADIAFDAGYYDQAHFTREFRRTIGLPPAAFRRLHAPLRPGRRARFSAS